VEKRKPHYSLGTIKATSIIQGMTREQFYKAMTSDVNSAIWQDVYHVPHGSIVLYVKFTTDIEGYLVISFKEK